MKKIAALLLLFTVSAAVAETRKFDFNFDEWPEGQPKEEAFVVDGKFTVVTKDGNRTLMAEVGELVEACVLLGDSAKGSSSIQAKVFATKQGRSLPRYSVGVHGQSGYRLVVAPSKKELQLTKGEEVIKTVPLEWTTATWLSVKLEVKKTAEKQWTITGKAWPTDKDEPKEGQLTHQDTTLRGQGKCSLWATPYSGTPIYFDEVKVEIDTE